LNDRLHETRTGLLLGRSRASALAFGLGLGLYLATLPQLGFNSDVYTYTAAIHKGEARLLFNPHHLLYNFTGRLWLQLMQALGLEWRADHALRVMNAVFGALGIGAFYTLAGRVFPSSRARLLATAAYATCFAVWMFSVDVEVYVPSTLFLLLSAVVLFRDPDQPSAGAAMLAGASMGMGALYHQMGALFAIPGAVALVCSRLPMSRRLGRVLLFWVTGGLVAFIPYTLAAVAFHGVKTAHELGLWLLGYAVSGYGAGWHLSSLTDFLLGQGRSIVFFDFVVKDLQVQGPRLLAQLAVVALIGSALVAGTIGAFLGWRGPGNGDRRVLAFAATWYLAYAVFTSWWEPENPEFYVTAMAPFWLLWAGGLARAGRRWTGLLAAVIVLMAASNGYDILRRKDVSFDPEVVAVRTIAERAGGDLVLLPPTLRARSAVFAPELRVLGVYAACKDSSRDPRKALCAIEDAIAGARAEGRKALLFERAFSREVLRPHPWCEETHRMLLERYETVPAFEVRLPVDRAELETSRNPAQWQAVAIVELRPRAAR
jgi:hypothetical protein